MLYQLRLALVYLVFFGLGLAEGSLLMAQSPNASLDEPLRLSGRVIDAQGKPIMDAEVRLIAPKDFSLPHETFGSVTVQSDASGEFALQVLAGDKRFMQGYHCKAMLLVRAAECELHTSAFHLTRCLVDAPLSIKLRPATPLAIHVLDTNGSPLANVTVRPAKIGEYLLPV